MKTKCDSLQVHISINRDELGKKAAQDIYTCITSILTTKSEVNIIFAAAPSQLDLFRHLLNLPIPWSQVNAFHMDEYIGLHHDANQSFRNFLDVHLFDHAPLKSKHYIQGESLDIAEECKRYERILKSYPTDIICLGIGENTHLAFNDPPANFHDENIIKVVELDEACRQQQVNDGCFENIKNVPSHALTLTLPTLMSGTYLFCVVPGDRKAHAVLKTLTEPINENHPSTKLRHHPNATLYLDTESSSLLFNNN